MVTIPPRSEFPGPNDKNRNFYALRCSPVFSSGVIPAVISEVFDFATTQQFQRTCGLCMCACDQNRSDQTQRSDIRPSERRAGHGRDATVITNASNGSRLAVGDAKRWHSELLCAKRCFYRVAQTLPETDRDEQVMPCQRSYSPLDISVAAYGSFGRESQGHQAVGQVPAQPGRQINTYNEDPSGALHLL